MRILIAASEVTPFAKTGGLADVTASLAKALTRRNHEVALILPKYLMVDRGGFQTEPIDLPLMYRLGDEERTGWIHKGKLPNTEIPVYFVVNDHYYNRNGIYQEDGRDYPDNLARFTFFCQAVLDLLRYDEFPAQVVHCHDWQTALVPTYLKTTERNDPTLQSIKTVFTVHNMAFQGFFPHSQLPITGLPWDLFTPDGIEFYGDINLLKAGLNFSDWITTVSERYAREMMTSEYGCGMETIVSANQHRLSGIPNGVDYEFWDPSTDSYLVKNYDTGQMAGKADCKKALQEEFGIQTDPHIPLLATVSRFDDQKGLDLVYGVMEILLLWEDIQFVVLGMGEQKYARLFQELKNRFPNQVGLHVGYDEGKAHRVFSGADLLLMPSRYEPFGLTQLYALRYGTPPIVRCSGGPADTVKDYNENQHDGYGFVFQKMDTKEFLQSIRRALSTYRDKTAWSAVLQRGMKCDFSWDNSAEKYEKLYKVLVEAPL